MRDNHGCNPGCHQVQSNLPQPCLYCFALKVHESLN